MLTLQSVQIKGEASGYRRRSVVVSQALFLSRSRAGLRRWLTI